MTNTNEKTGAPTSEEGGGGLGDKIRDYHRRGGPQGGGDAKTAEADIAATAIETNDDLKKGRPPSDPK